MSILFPSIQNLAIRSTPPHSAKFSPLLRKMGMTMSHQAAASLQLLSLLPVHGDSGRRKKSRQTPEDIWMCDHAVACEYELRCCATVKSGDGRLWPLSCKGGTSSFARKMRLWRLIRETCVEFHIRRDHSHWVSPKGMVDHIRLTSLQDGSSWYIGYGAAFKLQASCSGAGLTGPRDSRGNDRRRSCDLVGDVEDLT